MFTIKDLKDIKIQDQNVKKPLRGKRSYIIIEKRTSDLKFDKTDFESLNGITLHFIYIQLKWFLLSFPSHMVKAHFTYE